MTLNPLLIPSTSARPGFLKRLGFSTHLGVLNTRSAKKHFYQLAGPDELISFKEWQAALGLRNPLVARRLFELVDTDASGFVDLQEYLNFVDCLCDRKSDRRFQLLFAIYDQDNDGQLQLKDIQQLLEAGMDEQSLTVNDTDLTELARSFLNSFEGHKRNRLQLDDFVAGIKEYPREDSLFRQFFYHWISRTARPRPPKSSLQVGTRERMKRHLGVHWPSYFWTIIYLIANEWLFANAMEVYASKGAILAVQIARGFGACLNLNAALILVLMARGLWSGLRHGFLSALIPFDSLTDFHRRIGWIILAFSIGHICAHTYNYWWTRTDPYSLLFNPAFMTGVVASLAFVVLLAGVFHRTRRKREIFSSTHYCYAVFLGVMLFHGPHFWLWLAGPLLIYALDAIYRRIFKTRRVKILALQPLSDGVTWVRFVKPKGFRFSPGDYLFLRIAVLSRWQWHPFTLSAAPEADHFDLHIRNNGNWSGALQNLSRKSGMDLEQLVAHIDGPYGSPTTQITQSRIAVMVAAGIGVTPFASALESLVLQRSARKLNAPDQMIYFHWLNRSQSSYEWFQKLLTQAEKVLENQFKLYIHLTSFSYNLTNIATQIAVKEFYKIHHRDPFTQLHAITNPGRPNWTRLFSELKISHPGGLIDVYYCGPKELGRELESQCYKFGFGFFRERFD